MCRRLIGDRDVNLAPRRIADPSLGVEPPCTTTAVYIHGLYQILTFKTFTLSFYCSPLVTF